MYCPQCATPLAAPTARCPTCNLDVQAIAQMLFPQAISRTPESSPRPADGMAKMWQHQRHALGLLLVLCSLLVGCFIPICIGLFNGFIGLSSLILVLAGVAGVLLLLGSMLILAAEGGILTSRSDTDQNDSTSAHRTVEQNDSPPLLEHYLTDTDRLQDRPASQSANR